VEVKQMSTKDRLGMFRLGVWDHGEDDEQIPKHIEQEHE
jgi:hypothetical protein